MATDRLQFGTASSARKVRFAVGENLAVRDPFVREPITGSQVHDWVDVAICMADSSAIFHPITCPARMTGYNTIFIKGRDPFAGGRIAQ